jgi:hypothetical protein
MAEFTFFVSADLHMMNGGESAATERLVGCGGVAECGD